MRFIEMFLVPDTPPDITCYHEKGDVYTISWKVGLVNIHSLRKLFISQLKYLLLFCLYVPFCLKKN